MYQVFADDILIYDDTRMESTLKLVNPKLSISDSAAGSFTMTVPQNNPGYDMIQRMTTTIRVIKEGEQFWEGRVLQESVDFYNQRKLTCEGELAYLNDVTLTQHAWSYSGLTGPLMVKAFLIDIIGEYNSKARSDRQFTVGYVDVEPFRIISNLSSNKFERTTNYETVIECINNQLIGKIGGHIRIRHETVDGSDVRYIDYLKDDSPSFNTNSQIIRFGKNLMDFTRSFDSTKYATVVIPLGAKLNDEDIPSGEAKVGDLSYYLTVKSADDDSAGHASTDAYHAANSMYIVVDEAVTNYGRIEQTVHFDDIDNANILALRGELYLTDTQFDTVVIELTAFDLHYLNPEMEPVKIGDRIRVISEPHGMDRMFPVTKLEIPLDQPENTKFTLGSEIKMSLTATTNKVNAQVKAAIETEPDLSGIEDSILSQVEDDVEQLMNQQLNGYITITTSTDASGIQSDALYISNQRPFDPEHPGSAKYWRWNVNGLGFYDGSSWKTAMTMDGTILGERIAAGSIHGSKITTGTLKLVSTNTSTEYCTLSLQTNNVGASDLFIGNINSSGENVDSSQYVRLINKVYLSQNTQIAIGGTSGSYYYTVYRYGTSYDPSDPETGLMASYGEYSNGTNFATPVSAYYRIKVRKSSYASFSLSELGSLSALIELGASTVLSSANIQITGMVTFTSLDDYLGTAGHTVINGANIMTGTVSADMIDVTTLKVKTVYLSNTVTSDDYIILSSEIITEGLSKKAFVNIGSHERPTFSSYMNVGIMGDYIYFLPSGRYAKSDNTGLKVDPGSGSMYPLDSYFGTEAYLGGPTTATTSGGDVYNVDTYYKRIYLAPEAYLYHASGSLKYYDGSTDHWLT